MEIFATIYRQLPVLAIVASMLGLGWTVQHHLKSDKNVTGTDGRAEAIVAPSNPMPKLATALSASELNEITQRHLFGKVETPKAVEPVAVEEPKAVEPDFSNLPETRIPLKLSGIAFSPDKRRAFAMIITADGKQADYQAGEPIGKDATVHLIEEKRVVIDRSGNFEALTLPELSRPKGAVRQSLPRNNRSQPNRAGLNKSTSDRPMATTQQ